LEFNAPDPSVKKNQITKSKSQTATKLKRFLPSVKEGILLRDFTTFRIGGPADFFYTAKTEPELKKAIAAARALRLPFFILGRGSNVLFSDQGFRGLVVRNLVENMRVVRNLKRKIQIEKAGDARYQPADQKKYLQFSDLDYPSEIFDAEIEVASGSSLPSLVQWSLEKGLTGLQWFAGIPGSVGGGAAYNIHGGTKLFSDYVKSVTVLDKNDKIRKIQKDEADFAYDKSFFQKNRLIILRVNLFLSHGDVKRARFVWREWLRRKLKAQPRTNCPGSVFQNFSPRAAKKVGAPTTSAGWFIDQCGLKGKIIGGAQISEKHANFIVNLGSARARDVKKLIKTAQEAVKKRFGLVLRPEILILTEKIAKN
jgi:UDP-N-acetylmuramate dehydrogenase